MKNERPIFINAFAHGGSNILWNIFQSHPDVCSPIEETHVLFMRKKMDSFLTNTILHLGGDPNFFNNKATKKNISKFSKYYIDRKLYYAKLKTLNNKFNKYKTPDRIYTRKEIIHSRLVCKEVSKSANTSRFGVLIFRNMYPQATFFGLVRNGLSLCESYLRRNISNTPQKTAEIYNHITDQMIEYSRKYSNYHLIKFEDILGNPKKTIEKVYSLAGLDIAKLDKIRLKDKKILATKMNTRLTKKQDKKSGLTRINYPVFLIQT